jgi:hypothetical protein
MNGKEFEMENQEKPYQLNFLALILSQKSKQRDEWMTKIPEGRSALSGLAPRQFSRKGIGPGKRDDSWTDNPLDKDKPKKVHHDFEIVITHMNQNQVDDLQYLKEEMEAARQKEMDKLFYEQKVKLTAISLFDYF